MALNKKVLEVNPNTKRVNHRMILSLNHEKRTKSRYSAFENNCRKTYLISATKAYFLIGEQKIQHL